MQKFRYISFLFMLSLLFTGCDDFLDLNQNPDKASTAPAKELLPVVTFYAAQTNYDHAEYGVYLAGALTTGGRSQSGSLAYKSGWDFQIMNRHPQWRRHFYDIGKNVLLMTRDAEVKKSYNYMLIGRTINLMSMMLTTDMFGDMPRTEAYQNTAPHYDSQESIYEWMFQEVDALLADYDNQALTQAITNERITKSNERIYAGDLNRWKQFTYALKARLYLRKLPNWDNSPATCQIIIDAVDKALSDWKEPIYKYDGGISEKNCPWGPAQPVINSWESRKNELDKSIPTKFFLVNMLGIVVNANGSINDRNSDPRLQSQKLMTKRLGPDGKSAWRFLESNFGMDASMKESHYPDLFTPDSCYLTQNKAAISLMTTEELLFIKAEAQYWAGNKTESHETAVEAVRINMTKHRVLNGAIDTYMSKATCLPTSGYTIGHLMRQKYVAMYLQAEMWTDMRRYKYSNNSNGVMYDNVVIYPGLRRPYNLSSSWLANPNDWVQRINYDPETEEKYNKAELERLGAYRNPEWLKKPMIWVR